jgi:hypothetical protein
MTQLMEMETAATVLGTPAKELAFRVHSPHQAGPAQVVLLTGQKVSIGADPQCTLRLAGNKVEPCYCLVLRGESSDVIRSLSPRAKLNGADFQDAALQAGDRLQLDEVELEVLASPDAPERDLAAEQRVLDALAEELRQRGEALEGQFAESQRREQVIREREAQLTAMAETLGRDQGVFHEQRAAFAEERDATARSAAEASERRSAELRQQSEAVEARYSEAERLERTLRELEAKLAEDRQRLEDGRRELEGQRAALNAERETSAQQVSDSSRQEIEELQRRVESLETRERKFEAEKHELELEIRTLQAEREQSQSTRAQLEAERAQVAADRAEIQTLARQFEAESQAAEEARAALADMERKLKATQSELAARQQTGSGTATISGADIKAEREREQLRQEREAWEQERRRWDQECERWERESREFQAELEERERLVQQSLAELDTGREQLAAAEQQIAARYEEAEEATIVTPEEERRSTSRPASEAGEEEDSIHDYMQQLLERASVKGKGSSTVASHSSQAGADVKLRDVEPAPAKPAALAEQRARRPDRPRADQAVDLTTLREIANLTAKGALDRHSEKQSAQRRLNRVLLGGGGTAFVMIVLACLGIYTTVTAALAVAATAVAFLGWRQYQMSLRRFAVGAAEKAAGATLAADIAAADEESHVTPAG